MININPILLDNFKKRVPDPHALNFIALLNLTEENHITAVNNLVANLKGKGTTNNSYLWNKVYAIYPLIGGTSLRHSYNLVNQDKYRLTFYGSPLHNEQGITPNGINQYARTNFNPTLNTDKCFGIYYYTNESITKDCFLSGVFIGDKVTGVQIREGAATFFISSQTYGATYPYNQEKGGILGYSKANGVAINFNGIDQNFTNKITAGNYPDGELFLMGRNFQGNPTKYSASSCQAFCITGELTANEASDLHEAIHSYNLILNRGV